MRYSLIRHLDQLSIDRWARQGIRRVLRAAWLCVCVWCIGFGAYLLLGWPLRYDVMIAISLLILAIALLTLLRRRLPAIEVARRLDRRFQLNEQLATAVEVAAIAPARESIGARLLDESALTANRLRQQLTRTQPFPWRELLSILALILIVLGLYLLASIAGITPNLGRQTSPLAELAQPQSQPQQSAQQPQAGSGGQSGQSEQVVADPRILAALADALRDQGATRAAAEALDRGDTATAASELRELADQASQLSQESRGDLSDRLQQAARQIDRRDPGLAGQLRESARGLERGDQEASQAIDDLASAIEELQPQQPANASQNQPGQNNQPGQQGQQGQNGDAGQGQQGTGQSAQGQQGQQGQGQSGGSGAGNAPAEQRPVSPSQRIGVEGKPVELDAHGTGQQTESHNPQQATTAAGVGSSVPRASTANDSGASGSVGADPLRVPLEDRDVVQDYFSQ